MENSLKLADLAKNFNDEDKARMLLEQLRWPDGPVCPHCGAKEHYRLNPKKGAKTHARKGTIKCAKCRKQYTVMVGTIFEDSHIPLTKWLIGISLLCASKKGMSAKQLERMLGISYKSAWFMAHRIRFAMTQSPFAEKLMGVIEADETYIGGKSKGKRGRGASNKKIVFSLVERDGDVRSFPVKKVTAKNLKGIIREHVQPTAKIMTDEFPSYVGLNKEFASHETVNHGTKEYVRGEVYTNTIEGFFSILKRGINGIYHHVSEQHLERYLSEFDFRYNSRHITDSQRTVNAIKGFEGKRLMYQDSSM